MMPSASPDRAGPDPIRHPLLAVVATDIDPDNPLAGLSVGSHPEPEPPDGWTTITMRAAALNALVMAIKTC